MVNGSPGKLSEMHVAVRQFVAAATWGRSWRFLAPSCLDQSQPNIKHGPDLVQNVGSLSKSCVSTDFHTFNGRVSMLIAGYYEMSTSDFQVGNERVNVWQRNL